MKTRNRGILLALVLIISVFSVGFTAVEGDNKDMVSNHQTNTETGYVLKEHNGKIAIFKKGNNIPEKVLDIIVDALPERDISRLKIGIEAESFSQAITIAEDYE